FDSTRKRMTTVHKIDGNKVSYVKGAPDIILNLCDKLIIDGKIRKLDDFWKRKIMKVTEDLSNDALRVLGFAYKEVSGKDYENNLIFVGLQGMIDPPREEVKEAIKKCKTAGIRVIMITGDYKGTAVAIARELGIVGKAITGAEIKDINLDKEIEHIGVYARVNPEHKMQIINALKKKGHVVAMTGDGVNDAPALKASDIGIAMGITGTDVAKEASGMILTDDNFASIVNAVEEGRGVYDNIRKYFSFLISGNISEVIIVTLGIIFGWPLILSATQILFINLVTDGLPAVALSADPFEPNAMNRKPRNKKESIYSGLTPFIIYIPIIITTVSMAMFAWFYFGEGNLLKAQTAAFITISMFELFLAFSCSSIIYPIFKVGLFKNKWLILSVLTSLIITFGLMFIPSIGNTLGIVSLTMTEIAAIILLSSSGAVFIEIWKYLKHEI
ncbi:MAG: cation-translocating P-type ATPase, partial [Nanoarchaeota archaeon]